MGSGDKRGIGDVRAVVFDFDGVLVKPKDRNCENPFNILPQCPDSENGLHAAFEKIRRHVFRSTDWISELDEAGVDICNRQLLAEISNCVFQATKSNLSIVPGIEQTLVELSRQGILLGILTNNCPDAVSFFFEKLCETNRRALFQSIKTFLDVERLKPHPAGLLAICKEFELPPAQVLFVGDSLDDMTAAMSALAPFVYAKWADNDSVAEIPYDPGMVKWGILDLPVILYPSWLLKIIPGMI